MNLELRKTGINIIGDVPWGTHFCQFYKTAQDLLDILVPYFKAGLENDEFCMWVTSEPLGVEAARTALAAAVPDFEARVRRGQIEIIPHTDWYLKGGTFDSERVLGDWVKKLDEARAAGFEGLRLTGNTFWLEPKDWGAFRDYEAAVDDAIGRLRMLAACTYSLDRCGANEVLDVVRNHRFALIHRDTGWHLVENSDSRRAYNELERLAQFPEQNPNPVLRVTNAGAVIFANPPARALLEVMGSGSEGPVPPSLLALAKAAEGTGGVVEAEIPDGAGRIYWFTAVPPAAESYINMYARDITKRKVAEEEVARSREWLKVTLTSIGDAVIAADEEGRVSFLNPVAAALTGWTPEEALGRPIQEVFRIISEITRQPGEDIFARAISEQKPVALSNNTALLTRDGRETPIEDSAAPILDAAGRTVGVVLVFHDVTAKRETQRALRDSEEKYRLLFQNMAEGFALYELIADEAGRPIDWRVLEANEAYTLHTGIPRDRVVGRRIGELYPQVVQEYLQIFARVVATGTPESFETFAKVAGRYQRVYAFPAGGRRFACTIQDISERKRAEDALSKSEERYRNLFSHMTEGFALQDILLDGEGKPVDYRFIEINPAFERLTGFRRDDVVGRRVTEVLPDIEPFWIETYGRVAVTGEPVSFERHYPAPLDRWYNVIAFRPAPMQFAVIFMDITDRKRLEAELGKRTVELQSLFNHTNAGLVLFDAEPPYTVLAHNRYYQELFAEPFRSQGMVGKNIYEYAPAVEAQGVAAVFEEVVRTGKPVNLVDFPYESNPPQKSWFNWHLSPVIQDGRVVALASLSINVTDRHAAEDDLRRSRADLARALEVGQIGSWRLDIRRNVLTWSDENHRIFGVPKGTPLTYETFLAIVHPDDRQFVDERWNAGLRGAPYDIEHRIVADGQTKWVREKAYMEFNAAGELEAGFGITQDITERKNAEFLSRALAEQERLRLGAAVEQASDAVVMVDLDGSIAYVNAAFESINGLPRGEARGRSYFDLVAGDPADPAIRESIGKGQSWHGHLMRTIPKGRPVELEVTICPAADPSGKTIGGLVTEKDVTQENALQRQLRQAQKTEALGTLAGGITHDFNNILGAIIVNTELALLDLEEDHPARSPLPIVLQAAGRGKELVKQIITFSRQREWERKPVDVSPIVKEAMKFLHSTLPKDVAIHERISPDCGSVLADPSQIQQIVVNLCQNAALAMHERGGDLEVKLDSVSVDSAMTLRYPDLRVGRYVRLTVADTGCGIARENFERIFEPFFTTRGHGGGSGLGLAVVQGIVKGYGGAITVYSEPDKGSVFNVYLPRLEGQVPSEEAGRPARTLGGREKILIVEDEAAQRESLALSLGRLGYKVTARAGGRSALTTFRKNPAAFDVVITDQTMPRMSGLELAAEIVKTRPETPVILCTGFSEKVDRESIHQSGIREFIMKPYSLQEISQLIRKALRKEAKESPSA